MRQKQISLLSVVFSSSVSLLSLSCYFILSLSLSCCLYVCLCFFFSLSLSLSLFCCRVTLVSNLSLSRFLRCSTFTPSLLHDLKKIFAAGRMRFPFLQEGQPLKAILVANLALPSLQDRVGSYKLGWLGVVPRKATKLNSPVGNWRGFQETKGIKIRISFFGCCRLLGTSFL